MVGHRLTDIEKHNILAFSQHYGLPTNLLDITSNPLNALFFACHESTNKGYVYIYPKREFIDISKIVNAFPQESIIDLFLSGSNLVVNEIHRLFEEKFEGFRGLLQFTGKSFIVTGIGYTNHLFCKLFCITRDKLIANNKVAISAISYDEMLNNIQGDDIVRAGELSLGFYKAVQVERDNFSKLLEAVCSDEMMNDVDMPKTLKDDLMYYILLLLYCLRYEYREGNSNLSEYSDLFPPMIFRPQITFERARLQQGYFIYMPYRFGRGMYTDNMLEFDNILHIYNL